MHAVPSSLLAPSTYLSNKEQPKQTAGQKTNLTASPQDPSPRATPLSQRTITLPIFGKVNAGKAMAAGAIALAAIATCAVYVYSAKTPQPCTPQPCFIPKPSGSCAKIPLNQILQSSQKSNTITQDGCIYRDPKGDYFEAASRVAMFPQVLRNVRVPRYERIDCARNLPSCDHSISALILSVTQLSDREIKVEEGCPEPEILPYGSPVDKFKDEDAPKPGATVKPVPCSLIKSTTSSCSKIPLDQLMKTSLDPDTMSQDGCLYRDVNGDVFEAVSRVSMFPGVVQDISATRYVPLDCARNLPTCDPAKSGRILTTCLISDGKTVEVQEGCPEPKDLPQGHNVELLGGKSPVPGASIAKVPCSLNVQSSPIGSYTGASSI